MISDVHEAWCYMVVSSLFCTAWRHDVCNDALPCGFELSWWKVRLRES